MNFVELNGIILNYKLINADSGKPVIVFSNSLGTDFRIWDDCVADLSADFAIYYMTNAVMAYPVLVPRPMPLMIMSATLLA